MGRWKGSRATLGRNAAIAHEPDVMALTMIQMPPKPFRRAFAIATLGTIAAVAMALLPAIWGGRYVPDLAILTTTLIAVIWYTYFTYQAVNRVEPGRLRFDLRADVERRLLHIRLENPTRTTVTARINQRVWADDGIAADATDVYDGSDQSEVIVGPSERLVVTQPFPIFVTARTANSSSVTLGSEIFVAMWLTWEDAHGVLGTSHVRFWHIFSHPRPRTVRVVTRGGVLRHFGKFRWAERPALDTVPIPFSTGEPTRSA